MLPGTIKRGQVWSGILIRPGYAAP